MDNIKQLIVAKPKSIGFKVVGDVVYYDGYIVALLSEEPPMSVRDDVVAHLRAAITEFEFDAAVFNIKSHVDKVEKELSDKQNAVTESERAFEAAVRTHDREVIEGFLRKVKESARGGLVQVKELVSIGENYLSEIEPDNVPDPPLSPDELETAQ